MQVCVVLFLSRLFSLSWGSCLEPESTFQIQTLLPLPLLLSPPSQCIAFSFPTGWPPVNAVWRIPLSHHALPRLWSQGAKNLLLLFEEAGRKVWSHTLKRRKAQPLGGGVAPGHRGYGIVFCVFSSSWEDVFEVLSWHQISWRTGRFQDVEVALMSHQALFVT